MSMENFGIDVDIKLNDGDARSGIKELSEQLQAIKAMGERGITLDLGLSDVNSKKIRDMLNLVNTISSSNIKNAFEISDKSIDSLKALKDVAESIGKLSKKQMSLFNEQKIKKETDTAIKQYRQAQNEIRKLQTQMSKTVDSQVYSALNEQLKNKAQMLKSLRDGNKEKITLFNEEDTKHIKLLEQAYGKTFENIQNGAKNVSENLNKMTNNKVMDTDKLKEYKERLLEIQNLSFAGIDYSKLSNSNQQLDALKREITDFNKNNQIKILGEGNDSLRQYKAVQNEIKAIQTQMSKTTDLQSFGSLDMQLRDYAKQLNEIRSGLDDEQLQSVAGLDKVNADKMERIYAKVFDSIQKQARKMQTQLTELSKNTMIDTDELERVKSVLSSIMGMDFKVVQDYEVFSNVLVQVEKLKTSLSALNKGAKLDGFNQSDNVKEWKNLYNIITATKKEMARSTNNVSTMSYSKSLSDLNKQLNECYAKMTDVDKKTVDTLRNFGRGKLDTFFTKSADGIIKQAQLLETSLMNIGKNSFTDTSKLEEYQNKVKEIIQTMNYGIMEGTLNEFNIPYDKRQIDDLKNALKELGDETKKSLKIDDFISGMKTQLTSMKTQFKSALPDEEISRIQDKFKELKNISLDELPYAFKKINGEVQILRTNAQEVSKAFKGFDGVDNGINELVSKFNKLAEAGALSKEQIDDIFSRISQLSDNAEKIDLFGTGAEQEIKNISKEIKEISSEMKNIKVPNILDEWQKLNKEVKTYKEQLSKSYDSSTMSKLIKDIAKAENEMDSLVAKMNKTQVGDMLKISSQTDKGLQSYFRKQADGAIKELDNVKDELDTLFDDKYSDSNGIKGLIDDVQKLKLELKQGISLDALYPTGLNSSQKSINGIKETLKQLKQSANDLEKNASKPIKEYIEQIRILEQAHIQLAKSQSTDMSKKWTDNLEGAKSKLNGLYNELNKADKLMADKLNAGLDNKLNTKLNSQVDRMYTQISKLKDLSKDLSLKDFMNVSQLDDFDKKIDNVFKSLQNLEKVDGIGLNKISAELREIVEESKSLSKVANFGDKIASEIERLESTCTSSKLKQYLREVKNELNSFMDMPVGSNGIDKQMDKIENSLRNVQTQANKTGSFFNDLYDSMRTYTLGNIIGDGIVQSGREAINVVKELDSALVEMTRVAPKDFEINTENLSKIKQEASAIGKEVGKASSDVIIGIGEALRVGAKSIGDAKEIAKQSAIFSNVADLDQAEASRTINSVLSAFGGIKNALQPVRGEVKGATEDYTNLSLAMDLINFAGRIYTT